MNLSTAIPTFLITLREGVEAALVVGIVLAFLKKARQSHLNSWVYAGIGVGIVVSGCLGLLFSSIVTILAKAYPQYTGIIEPAYEGVFCVLAIAMLSWMLIWMTKQARSMKNQVEGALSNALKNDQGAGWGIFLLILVAVVREGFETVLFITGSFSSGIAASLGALAGIAVAAGIGVMLFRWGIKINIKQFFQVMGTLLVLIVSGLVVTALKRFDETMAALALANRASESLCFYYEHFAKLHSCVLGPLVWNAANFLPDDRFPGIILKSLFGYRQHLFLLQAIAYILFLVTVGGLYFRSLSTKPPKSNQKLSLNQK